MRQLRAAASPAPRDDAAMRAIVVGICRAAGFDIEAATPPGWWGGLASYDLDVFNAAWDRLEEDSANVLGIPDDLWVDVLSGCFARPGWAGEWVRVMKRRDDSPEPEASDGGA